MFYFVKHRLPVRFTDCQTLLSHGDQVAATLRRLRALDDLGARYDDRLWTAPLDVTDGHALGK